MSEDIVRRLRWLMGSEAGCKDLRIAMIAKLAIDEIEKLREHRRRCHKDITTAMNRVQMEVVSDMQREIDALRAAPEGTAP